MLLLYFTRALYHLFRVRNKNSITSCLLFVLFLSRAGAQNPIPLNYEVLNINNGLSQGYVSSIVQDRKGFMWFGTNDGLNKYNGYTFDIFHHDPEDSTSIASDDITAVFEDSEERLWILTRHNGIDLFDRENITFIHFRNAGENSIRSNNLLTITEDKTGALWIRTDKGIDRLQITNHPREQTAKTLKPLSPFRYRFTHIEMPNVYLPLKNKLIIPYLYVDNRNHILLSTNTNIWEIVFNVNTYAYEVTSRYEFKFIDYDYMPTMIEDPVHKNFYVNNGTVYKFFNNHFDSSQVIYRGASSEASWTIDKRERLWVKDTSKIILLNLLSGSKEIVVPMIPEYNKWLNTSTCYYTDRTGIIWIGTGGYGILKYNPEIEQFHHILPQLNTYQLFETNTGKIVTNNMVAITIKKNTPVSAQKLLNAGNIKKHLPKAEVLTFAKDNSDKIYIGTHGAILEYNPAKGLFSSVPIPSSDQVSRPFPIYADTANNLWMGYNKVFIRYNKTSKEFTRFDYVQQSGPFDYDFLQCIYQENNNLWLGSQNGLFLFDTIKKSTIHYVNRISDTSSLGNNYILSIFRDTTDNDSNLWIGTKGGGLNKLNTRTGKFTKYTTKNGLANNVVYGILSDSNKNLWLSTNNGISEFNPSTGKFRNFHVSDGLQGNEFNRYAYLKTRQGIMIFGGLNGINYFKPEDIKSVEHPDVVMTDFRLFNKKVSLKNSGSPLNKDISFINSIRLEYIQNVVTFQFAAMDYRKAGGAQYRYMMEGFDKDWIYSGTAREATYTNLNPGDYRFIVQGTFETGNWGIKRTAVSIVVFAPWYMTIWFYLAVAIFTATVTYALYRYRLNQLSKLELLRNRIARDLHDEVGSSISTIAIYSKIVHEHLGNATFNNDSLMKKITDNAHEIMESMNDIVWNINAKNDAFEHIISRMREHAHQLLEAKGYALHFNFDENLYKMKLQMEKRRDFYLVYKEALNNIAKYANGTTVWITLTVHNMNIQLTIRDDGRGFDMETIRKTSNGLNNMTFRAGALNGKIKITSTPGKGTEIKMSF